MENLDKDKENSDLFNCSQCNKMLDLSGKFFYCENCKSNFCDDCLKGHNEIFFDHDIHQTNEVGLNNMQEDNSLKANPDSDIGDRFFSDNKLPEVNPTESEMKFLDLTFLFNKTVNSIEKNFNEEISRLKAQKNKNKENNNGNIINITNVKLDLEQLRQLPPLERLKKIMENVSFK